jgi:hypothetical protein
LQRRFKEFEIKYKSLFKRRHGISNLLPSQRIALQSLQQNNNIIVVQCDKNLGPTILEKQTYIQMAMRDHLQYHDTY